MAKTLPGDDEAPSADAREHQVLHLGPALTIYHAAACWADLARRLRPGERLVLDLGGVTELDSAGVQVLLMASRTAAQQGTALTLCNPSPTVCAVFELMALDLIKDAPC